MCMKYGIKHKEVYIVTLRLPPCPAISLSPLVWCLQVRREAGSEVRQLVKQGMTGKSISGVNFSVFYVKSLRNHKNLLLYSYFLDG